MNIVVPGSEGEVKDWTNQVGVESPPYIKIGYRPWNSRKGVHLSIKIGLSSPMFQVEL